MDIKALQPVAGSEDLTPKESVKKVETPRVTYKDQPVDAVAVDLSTNKAPDTKSGEGAAAESSGAEAKEKARKALEEAAAELKKELNRTEVKFDVEVTEGEEFSTNDLRFRVVEKETGEVVREFPPEKVLSHMKEGDGAKRLSGMFFAGQA